MKKRISVLAVLFVLFFSCNVFAVPSLKLPFKGGEKWKCDQGNYNVWNLFD